MLPAHPKQGPVEDESVQQPTMASVKRSNPTDHELGPEQQMQLTNANQFTPSCSRCRKKKLKCDTNLPCNQCVSKGLQHECRKDARIPRGRKKPKLYNQPKSHDPDNVTALKKRIQQLESLLLKAPHSPPSSGSNPTTSSRTSQQSDRKPRQALSSHAGSTSTGPSEIDPLAARSRSIPPSVASDDEEEPPEAENAAIELEKLAASDPRVGEPGHGRGSTKQIHHVRPIQIGVDGPHPFYNRPSQLQDRVEILSYTKSIMPDPMIVDELISTFDLRCHPLVGNIIHMPSLIRDVRLFSSSSPFEIMTSHLDMYDLARYCMVLRLGMRFYPWQGNVFVDATRKEFIAVNAFKNRSDDVSIKWRDLAKKALAADKSFSLGSLKAIQTALLMILDGRDSPNFLRMLLRISIQTALDMGLHRQGKAIPYPGNTHEDLTRIETGVRIWWYLVVKDWCSAQREGSYMIHPAQMTTRKPLHTTDELIGQGVMDELPLHEHCRMSYVLCQIQLAHIIRESIDLRNEQSALDGSYSVITPTNRKRIQTKLENFLSEDLPPFYRLGSVAMNPGVLAVQRCLLHQQTFDVLLKLNRRDIGSQIGRSACTLLAEQIVSSQKLLRSVCSVIDAFWVNFLHLFGATLTLTLSLILDQDLDEEIRRKRRDKVIAALSSLRETPGSDRGSCIIETLLEEEEQNWVVNQQGVRARARPFDLSRITQTLVNRITYLDPVGGLPNDDGVPEESLVPTFSSNWGEDVCDPMGLLAEDSKAAVGATSTLPDQTSVAMHSSAFAAPVLASSHASAPPRPYMYSLHPWDEPPAGSRSTSFQAVSSSSAMLPDNASALRHARNHLPPDPLSVSDTRSGPLPFHLTDHTIPMPSRSPSDSPPRHYSQNVHYTSKHFDTHDPRSQRLRPLGFSQVGPTSLQLQQRQMIPQPQSQMQQQASRKLQTQANAMWDWALLQGGLNFPAPNTQSTPR